MKEIKHTKRRKDKSLCTFLRARRTFSGMVAAMDEAVGNLTVALQEAALYQNTLIGNCLGWWQLWTRPWGTSL